VPLKKRKIGGVHSRNRTGKKTGNSVQRRGKKWREKGGRENQRRGPAGFCRSNRLKSREKVYVLRGILGGGENNGRPSALEGGKLKNERLRSGRDGFFPGQYVKGKIRKNQKEGKKSGGELHGKMRRGYWGE